MYPVESYNVLVVKDSRRAIFNTSWAEGILHSLEQYVEILYFTDTTQSFSRKIEMTELRDSDELKAGVSYVVIIFADYDAAYKRLINNVDDFLSVSSSSFQIIV
ncbi:MAG: hypothetical protein HRT57_09745 [Crocinitomicaceae bacterium]|nr:hypothetical protein [Crocinitomicaceae bacterium]